MRILIISEIFLPSHGGLPVAVAQLASELTRAKHSVKVVTTGHTFWHGKPRVETMDGYEVVRLHSMAYPIDPKNYRLTIYPDRDLKRIITEFKPDCIHMHTPWGALHNAAVRIARKQHIPTVVTNHVMAENLVFNVKWAGAFGRWIADYVMRSTAKKVNKTDLMTAPTEMALDLFGRDRVKVPAMAITNGVDTTWYNPTTPHKALLKKLDIDPNKPYFASVGRLGGEKRLDLLLDAFNIVRKQDDTALLVIGGKGPQRENLEAQVKRLGLGDHVRFLGFISDEEKRAVLQGARTYVNPSPSELQCIVGMESLACGTSIIVADAGAVPELCKPGENGLIFHYPDIEDLAAKMMQLWKHPIPRSTLEKAGREFIVSEHDTSAMIRAYVGAYERLKKQR